MSKQKAGELIQNHTLIGKVVRALRMAKGIGVNQLGNTIGLEPSNLSRFERGLSGGVHASKYLDNISDALDTRPAILHIIADLVAQDMSLLEQPDVLCRMVDRLTVLIQYYLQHPAKVQESINEQLIRDGKYKH